MEDTEKKLDHLIVGRNNSLGIDLLQEYFN